MSRPDRFLRRYAATALLLVVVLTWVPVARASGGDSLTQHYPLGTQTLCCQAGSGHSGPGSRTKAASTPRAGSTTRSTRGHGGVPILLLVAIAVVAFAPAAFIFRAGFLPRGRAPRYDPHSEPDGASSSAIKPVSDDGAPPGSGRDAAARPSQDFEEGLPNGVENGDVAFNLGVLLYERGHLGSAEAAWRRAAERCHAQAATRLGMALEQRGDVEGASEAYRDAERWGDADASERAAALHRPRRPSGDPQPAEESVSE